MALDVHAPVAVLSGDVVGSSSLSLDTRRRLAPTLAAATETLRATLGVAAVPLPVDVYGGDAWQLLLPRPSTSLRAALLLRAVLRSELADDPGAPVDTRVVIARGGVDFLAEDRVSRSEGEAFRLSGRTLTGLGPRRMAFVPAGRSHLHDWDVVARLLDVLVSDWTAKQARAMVGALQGWRQDRIAALWDPPVSQPTVAGHLRSAHADTVTAAVTAFEARLASLEDEPS
ncbi:MAG TPA: hypothetical protein VKA86_19580 [Candidatus Krumholzibacteria bacterium]|nr:hypothetical protein [Candidatus Krumholzibacteria bacterium]